MATIHSLAPEIISRIISMSSTTATVPDDEYIRRPCPSYKSLHSIARVCRRWTTFAQQTLWKDVVIREPWALRSFLEAGPGRHPVGRLILDFEFFRALYPNNTVKSEQRDWHALEPILRRCRGVRVLSIGGWGWGHQDRLEFDWMSLSGPGWADLKSLEFKYNESLPSSPTDTISFPFSLTTLRILQGPTGSPSEATALALCQSSITSLEISHQDTRQTLFNIFLPVAPQFTSLVIGPWSHGETDAVDHFLKNCTQLKNLRLSGLATKWQDHLVVPLEEFWFCALAADELDDLAIILVSSSIALSQLKRLFFEPDADTHWEEEDEVKRVCEEKGITSFWVEDIRG